jgi:general secretion pathway protein G
MVEAARRAGQAPRAIRGLDPAGFTLIELLVCLSVIALLLTLVAPRYFPSVSRAEETVLKSNLALLRDALDKYHADSGQYPDSLEALVHKRYIRSIPLDPVTKSETTWQIVPPQEPAVGGVFDVRSGAAGTARDGSKFSDW